LCQLEKRGENDNFCPNTVYGISLRADGCGGYLSHKKALARLLLTLYASICATFIPKPYPDTIQSLKGRINQLGVFLNQIQMVLDRIS
jgi:hypothetical protein